MPECTGLVNVGNEPKGPDSGASQFNHYTVFAGHHPSFCTGMASMRCFLCRVKNEVLTSHPGPLPLSPTSLNIQLAQIPTAKRMLYTERRPREHTARRLPSANQGERPWDKSKSADTLTSDFGLHICEK